MKPTCQVWTSGLSLHCAGLSLNSEPHRRDAENAEGLPGSARFQRAYGFAIINRARKMRALPGIFHGLLWPPCLGQKEFIRIPAGDRSFMLIGHEANADELIRSVNFALFGGVVVARPGADFCRDSQPLVGQRPARLLEDRSQGFRHLAVKSEVNIPQSSGLASAQRENSRQYISGVVWIPSSERDLPVQFRRDSPAGERADVKAEGLPRRTASLESGEGDVPRRVPVFACVSLVSLHGGLPCEDNVVEIAKGRDGEFKTGEESS